MKNNIIDISKAKSIEASVEIRVQKCKMEIDRILNFYDCALDPNVTISSINGIITGVRIIAKQQNKLEV